MGGEGTTCKKSPSRVGLTPACPTNLASGGSREMGCRVLSWGQEGPEKETGVKNILPPANPRGPEGVRSFKEKPDCSYGHTARLAIPERRHVSEARGPDRRYWL